MCYGQVYPQLDDGGCVMVGEREIHVLIGEGCGIGLTGTTIRYESRSKLSVVVRTTHAEGLLRRRLRRGTFGRGFYIPPSEQQVLLAALSLGRDDIERLCAVLRGEGHSARERLVLMRRSVVSAVDAMGRAVGCVGMKSSFKMSRLAQYPESIYDPDRHKNQGEFVCTIGSWSTAASDGYANLASPRKEEPRVRRLPKGTDE